jgi:N-acetylglucosaminyldiphosphoundecaprenol N-acetyl-beta-D-mannosaminyltransferase
MWVKFPDKVGQNLSGSGCPLRRVPEGRCPIVLSAQMELLKDMWAHELTVGVEPSIKPAPVTDATTEASLATGVRLPIAMLGVAFDQVTFAEAVKRIEDMVAARTPHYVVTANVDFLVQCQKDVELHRILLEAQLVLCDGMPLVWASKALGNPLPERVTGADLVPRLIEVAAEKKYRLFFLGSTPEANAQAVANLHRQYPELIIAGHYSPPFRALQDMDHDEIARRIREARADILFVSLGCPKQEKWIAMHYRTLGVPVSIGVGAVIDFLAGRFQRAPTWAQAAGAEWIFRLLQEPRRLFRRYANGLWHFGRAMFRQWWTLRLAGNWAAREPGRMLMVTEPDWQRIRVPERLDLKTINRDVALWRKTGSRHCLLDVSEVGFIDSTGVALLVRLRKRLRGERRHLVLILPSPVLTRALESMRLADYFLIASDAVEARRLILELSEEIHPAMSQTVYRPLIAQNEITAANGAETWEALSSTIHGCSGRRKEIRFDLSSVQFIDSTGLGLLIRARKTAQQRGVSVGFFEAQPNVRNVLRLAGMENTLLEEVK